METVSEIENKSKVLNYSIDWLYRRPIHQLMYREHKTTKQKGQIVCFFLVCDLLGLFYGFRHGQKDAVEQNGCHDDIVKIRMCRQVNGDTTERIPRRKQETRTRRRETVDVILPESVGHHHKRLLNWKCLCYFKYFLWEYSDFKVSDGLYLHIIYEK